MRYNEAMHELGDWQQPMHQQIFAPQPILSPYFKSYQLLTGELRCLANSRWYILPDNSAHLIFYLFQRKNSVKASLRLIGPRTRHQIINRINRRFTFIATFKPGVLGAFCRVPVNELTDSSTDAMELFDWCDNALLERLAAKAGSLQIREFVNLLEQQLITNLVPQLKSGSFLKAFSPLLQNPYVNVNDLAKNLGISDRHLRSLCKNYIGHSPKSVLQIERFTRSLLMSNDHREWTAIAYEAGYYDQSHMIAEYQKMTGKSPERLFSL